MVTLSSAEKALKEYYLDVVSNQINTTTSPFLAKIEQTQNDVWGKEIVKLVQYGINGGIGAGTEVGALPIPDGNNYAQFRLSLKNLYGSIEISDKAIRASGSNEGAFLNLLNAEMEGLLRAAKFNLGRMLYGDGRGVLEYAENVIKNGKQLVMSFSNFNNFIEGLVVDVYSADGTKKVSAGKISEINKTDGVVIVECNGDAPELDSGSFLTVQGSFGNEITGLGALFGEFTDDLYGHSRRSTSWLNPLTVEGGVMSVNLIQSTIDALEEKCASDVDMIVCASDVRRMYLDELNLTRRNIDFMNLDGGFKAISYNGIPVVTDRFVKNGDMYILNSKDFKLHQLCDWRWIEGDSGKILRQKPGSATYTATLVKYADLMCDRPCGQAMIKGITAGN